MQCKKDELIVIISGDCCGRNHHGVYRMLADCNIDTKYLNAIEVIDTLINYHLAELYEARILYIYEDNSCGIPIQEVK